MIHLKRLFVYLAIPFVVFGCKKTYGIEKGLWIIVKDTKNYSDEQGNLVANWKENVINDIQNCKWDVAKFEVTWRNEQEVRGKCIVFLSDKCYKESKTGVFLFSADKLELNIYELNLGTYRVLSIEDDIIKLYWDWLIFNKVVYLVKLPKDLEKNFSMEKGKNYTL